MPGDADNTAKAIAASARTENTFTSEHVQYLMLKCSICGEFWTSAHTV